MIDKHLHIVTHDIPWPADYGGVIDLFYKIQTLHHLGVKIHLHCFTQKYKPQTELNQYCYTINYYQRKKNIGSFSFHIPFIVNSRKDNQLIKNLQKDRYPVLLEGIHCTYYLHIGALNNRKIMVRLHNVEFEYYKNLAKHESFLPKKIYYLQESRLLKKYEYSLVRKAVFATVSRHDLDMYRHVFNAVNIVYIPVFLPHKFITAKTGKDCFCLYHGNLSVNENEAAVIWLLQEVFKDLPIPFIIAGKAPSPKLKHIIKERSQTYLVPNPSEEDMQELIVNAQIQIIPSFNNTGIKLKLLNALFNGRHCLVNEACVKGSDLQDVCHIASDAVAFKKIIVELYQKPFTGQDIIKRGELLCRQYNNEKNALTLMSFLY